MPGDIGQIDIQPVDGRIGAVIDASRISPELRAELVTQDMGVLKAAISADVADEEHVFAIPVVIETTVLVRLEAKPKPVDGIVNRWAHGYIDVQDIRTQVAAQINDPADMQSGDIDLTKRYDVIDMTLTNG